MLAVVLDRTHTNARLTPSARGTSATFVLIQCDMAITCRSIVAGTVVLALIGATISCSQRLTRTPDGWQPPERPYRVLALDESGALMGRDWQIASHVRRGNDLVRREADEETDLRFTRASGAMITIRTAGVSDELRSAGPRRFADVRRKEVCTSEDSGLAMTPLGIGWSETSIYFSFVTLKTESFEIEHRPGFAMIIDRGGAGPVGELRLLIAALHASGEATAIVVTYSASPDTFDSGLASAKDLISRIR